MASAFVKDTLRTHNAEAPPSTAISAATKSAQLSSNTPGQKDLTSSNITRIITHQERQNLRTLLYPTHPLHHSHRGNRFGIYQSCRNRLVEIVATVDRASVSRQIKFSIDGG